MTPGSVVAAVDADLAEIAERAPKVAASALAATARALAAELDAPNSATSKANCAKALMDALVQLRELAPPVVAMSPLDEIRARRDAKLGLSDAPDRVRPRRGRAPAQ